NSLRLVILMAAVAAVPIGFGADQILESGPQKTHLLELYTSEGCSSCPPAESWMSKLKAEPRLWKDFVPVAFHVDYWDRLGWRHSGSISAPKLPPARITDEICAMISSFYRWPGRR